MQRTFTRAVISHTLKAFSAPQWIPSELDSYSLRKCRNPKKQFGSTTTVNSLTNRDNR
jgi:hypothetical protein